MTNINHVHTSDEVMKAMAVLHKLVQKQSASNSLKNSKYHPSHVDEHSLMRSVLSIENLYEGKEVDRLLDIVQGHAEELNEHLKDLEDKEGLKHVGAMLRMLGAAISASHDGK